MANRSTITIEVIGDASSAQRMFRVAGEGAQELDAKLAKLEAIRFSAKTLTVDADIKAAERRLDDLESKASQVARKAADLGDKMSLGFSLPFTAAVGTMLNSASDLGESVNKVEVIFGAAGDGVKRWAEDNANAFGLAKGAALDAAGGFGAFTNVYADQQQAANDSIELIKRAADVSSLFNVSQQQSTEAIKSGLAGQSEALRPFGVLLTEGKVKAEAYASGIAAAGKELSEGEKIQARFNLIMRESATAAGDYANTASSLPNQTRALKSEFSDLGAELGAAFIPAATKVLQIVSTVADGFAALPGPVQTGAVAFGGLVAVLGPVLSIGGRVVESVTAISAAVGRLRDSETGVVSLGTALKGLGVATGVAAGLLALKTVMDGIRASEHAKDFESLSNAIGDRASGALNELVAGAAKGTRALDELAELYPQMKDVGTANLRALNSGHHDLANSVVAGKHAIADLERSYGTLLKQGNFEGARAVVDSLREMGASSTFVDGLADKLAKAVAAQRQHNTDATKSQDILRGQAAATIAAATATETLDDRIKRIDATARTRLDATTRLADVDARAAESARAIQVAHEGVAVSTTKSAEATKGRAQAAFEAARADAEHKNQIEQLAAARANETRVAEEAAARVAAAEGQVAAAREARRSGIDAVAAAEEAGAARVGQARERAAAVAEQIAEKAAGAAEREAEARAGLAAATIDAHQRTVESAEQAAGRIAAASERLAETESRAAEQVVAARDAQARSAEDHARKVADAEAAVQAAVESGAERVVAAQQDAARKIADAQARVSEATERAAEVAARAAGDIANAQAAAADAVADAASRIAEAEADYADKVAASQQRVADAAEKAQARGQAAAEKVAEARQRAADRAAQADEKVASARRALGDAQERAADQAAASARKTAEAAQRASEVRVDAAARVRDAEQSAAEKVEDAQRRVADAYRTAAERAEQADERLAEARERAGERIAEANAKLAEAQELVDKAENPRQRTEAAAALARAQTDAAKIRADVSKDLAKAEKEAARSTEDSARAVADAEAAAAKAAKDTAADVVKARESAAQAVVAADTAAAAAVAESIARSDTLASAERALAAAVTEAARQRADAAADLAKVERDAAKDQADAARDVQRAQADAAKAQQDATAALAKAKEAAAEQVEAATAKIVDAETAAAKAIGDAQKQVESAQQSAGRASLDAAAAVEAAQTQTAAAVDAAKARVVDAQRESAEAAEDNAAKVAKAEQDSAAAVTKAQREVTTAKTEAARSAAKAAEDERDTVEAAKKRVDEAERNTVEVAKDAARQRRDAARDVSEAEKQATRDLVEARSKIPELNDRVRDAVTKLRDAEKDAHEARRGAHAETVRLLGEQGLKRLEEAAKTEEAEARKRDAVDKTRTKVGDYTTAVLRWVDDEVAKRKEHATAAGTALDTIGEANARLVQLEAARRLALFQGHRDTVAEIDVQIGRVRAIRDEHATSTSRLEDQAPRQVLAVSRVVSELNEAAKPRTVTVDGDMGGIHAKIIGVVTRLTTDVQRKYDTTVDVVDNATPKIGSIRAKIGDDIDGKTYRATLDTVDNASTDIGSVVGKMTGEWAKHHNATMGVANEATARGQVDNVTTKLADWRDKQITLGISNEDAAKRQGDAVTGSVAGFKDKSVTLTLNAEVAKADALRRYMDAIDAYAREYARYVEGVKNGENAVVNRPPQVPQPGAYGLRSGGLVPGAGDGDIVPAMLEPGEFVLRREAVRALGPEILAQINAAGAAATRSLPASTVEPAGATVIQIEHLSIVADRGFDADKLFEQIVDVARRKGRVADNGAIMAKTR